MGSDSHLLQRSRPARFAADGQRGGHTARPAPAVAVAAIAVRRLRPDDSIDALTSLLRRAFARLGASGQNCSCVDQSADTTRQRIARGECLVALEGERIVGTVTLETADQLSAIACYRHDSVASLHQLAVEPSHQGRGIGQLLLAAAETWAFRQRCRMLALDTPEPARHLHAFYAHHGFSRQATVQLEARGYCSAVFSKAVRRTPRSLAPIAWPPRHPAEMALLGLQRRAQRRIGG